MANQTGKTTEIIDDNFTVMPDGCREYTLTKGNSKLHLTVNLGKSPIIYKLTTQRGEKSTSIEGLFGEDGDCFTIETKTPYNSKGREVSEKPIAAYCSATMRPYVKELSGLVKDSGISVNALRARFNTRGQMSALGRFFKNLQRDNIVGPQKPLNRTNIIEIRDKYTFDKILAEAKSDAGKNPDKPKTLGPKEQKYVSRILGLVDGSEVTRKALRSEFRIGEMATLGRILSHLREIGIIEPDTPAIKPDKYTVHDLEALKTLTNA